MIKSTDIRDAISDLIKIKAGLNLKVYFNHVLDSSESYAWVRLRPARRDEGHDYFQRRISVDISVVLVPDEYAEIKHTELLDIADALDEATHGYIQILDRNVTIYDTNVHIFDDILHYEFVLEFADYVTSQPTDTGFEEYDKMEELHVKKK